MNHLVYTEFSMWPIRAAGVARTWETPSCNKLIHSGRIKSYTHIPTIQNHILFI